MEEELKYDKEEEISKRDMKSGRGVSLNSEEWEDEEEKGSERSGNAMGRCWVDMSWKRLKEERRRRSQS